MLDSDGDDDHVHVFKGAELIDFDQGEFEDDAWSSPGVIGFVFAAILVVLVLIVGSLLENDPTATDGITSIARALRG